MFVVIDHLQLFSVSFFGTLSAPKVLFQVQNKVMNVFFIFLSRTPLHIYVPFSELQLKELEKLGPKKGVISQSVKDVVQSLVDDDLVSKDKIGTSVSNLS